MMHRLFGLCIFYYFIFHSNLSAQLQEFKFGDIDETDLEMIVYPLDSGAEAAYLLDFGNVTFNESNFSLFMNVHVRIKILKESGLDRADVELTYSKGNGNIQKLKSATYNLENGKLKTTTISKKEWVDEKENGLIWTKKLSFPDVKVGSIIEYTYSRNVGSFTSIPTWRYQQDIPVRYSEYKVQMPKYGDYSWALKGSLRLNYQSASGGFNHTMMKNVPALKREPYVASMNNFRSKLEFELKSVNIPGRGSQSFMKSWGAINAELMEDDEVAKALEGSQLFNRIYPTDKSWGNEEKSLIEIYNYVRDHFKWSDVISFFMNDDHKAVWDETEATAGNINISLGTFLRRAGIEAHPVILSTRRSGYINRRTPLIGQFNYVVICAIIDEKQYLLDATDKFRPYNVLPERALNGTGLMITKDGPVWLDMDINKEIDAKTVSAEFGINDDDMLDGKMSLNFRGTAASRMRDVMFQAKEKDDGVEDEEDEDEEDDDEEEESLEDYKIGEISDLKVENLEDAYQNLKVNYNFAKEEGFDFIGDKIFMSPVLIKHIEENPFKLDKRNFPVELPAPVADTYLFKIHIPDGYEVEELPKSQNIVLPNKAGRYLYTIGIQDDFVQVMIRLNLMKTNYQVEEYVTLKELFNLIISKQEEQIVFKEKEG